MVQWECDPATLPLFSGQVLVHDSSQPGAAPIAQRKDIQPHALSTELDLPGGASGPAINVELRFRDIFDNEVRMNVVPTINP